jgi:hypothetical protein
MLPTPTIETVEAECSAFDADPSTAFGEDALAELLAKFPENTKPSHVLLKVIVLDQRYSTRLRYVELDQLACHIASKDIDSLMAQGATRAVDLIWDCADIRHYYSFATKFCSWHNPTAYPIYDSYVNECLWTYKNQDSFHDFHRDDMYDYEKFVPIVSTFRNYYGLNCFDFRSLDKFLWRTGDQILRTRYMTS